MQINMDKHHIKELISAALTAREYSYSPYSGFAVGAALLTESGKIYTGCNVENAAYSPTNCAERTAFFKAVSEGEKEFAAIAVCGGKAGRPPAFCCAPCGVCRQVMAEFCRPEFIIYSAVSPEVYDKCTLADILPMAFGPGSIREADNI